MICEHVMFHSWLVIIQDWNAEQVASVPRAREEIVRRDCEERLSACDVPSREPIAPMLISAEINHTRVAIFSTEREQLAICAPGKRRDRRVSGLARQHLGAVVDTH